MEGLRHARHLIRGLAKSRSFAATALVTLAIGIGASTAVFSVINGVLLRPLAYPDADRLVSIKHVAPGAPGIASSDGDLLPSLSMFFTYADQNRTFESVGLWGAGNASVTGLEKPEQARAIGVTDGFFATFAVPPAVGRTFTKDEFQPGLPAPVMLSYEYWQSHFGGAASAIGQSITVNSRPAGIVGVMPRGFRVTDVATDLFLPAQIDRAQLTLPPFCCQVVARLKPGATLADANADVARMFPIWLDSWPFGGDAHAIYERGWRITPALRPLKQDVVGNIADVLWVVMGTIGVVLLIACANVTNLLLVRAEARRRELAVRAALGAATWQLGRTLLFETVGLAVTGGALGLAVAYGALRALLSMGPANLPRLSEISLDGAAVAFALAVSLFVGIVLGIVPALRYTGPKIGAALHSGGSRGSSLGRERHRAQGALVVAQVALALVLLVSSGLMIRTFQALSTVDPGFTAPSQIQTLRVAIPAAAVAEPERVLRMQNDILDALAAIPGVESAAYGSSMPLEGLFGGWDGIEVDGRDNGAPGERAMRTFKFVSPGFFATAGTRVVAGRELEWNEIYAATPVALVSENLARELWGEPAAAVGKRIRLGEPSPWREVVGVVQDVREASLSQAPPKVVYWPSLMTQFYRPGPGDPTGNFLQRQITVVIRSPLAGTAAFMRQVEQAVWSVNPSLPVTSVQTMQEVYARSLAQTSFVLVLLAVAGAAALVLGVVGLYGVLAYVVAQRRREIAIRLALGAQQRAVTQRFVRYGVALAAVGVAIGLAAAAGVTRLMASLLFDVQPVDAWTYAVVAAALTAVAALASYLPARKAARVDPSEALAAE
jgi:predicted permease